MYCDTPQVNQLTALLLAHGVRHVIVCPGSRNATIVHNLWQAADEGASLRLHPVTDERSAAFVALGIALATGRAAAVCVTSGSALLGCLPAVAEAYYRNIPLLVISADRPQPWIDQLDGQTLPQVGALAPYCSTFNIYTPHTDEQRWHVNRLINEALNALQNFGGAPAHINVGIEEPMFSFNTPRLPRERVVQAFQPQAKDPLPDEVIQLISEARLPALFIGQCEREDVSEWAGILARDCGILVFSELISNVKGASARLLHAFDALAAEHAEFVPDVVVQIGGNFVHKRFKKVLREADCKVVRVGLDRNIPDTFGNLVYHVQCDPLPALIQLNDVLEPESGTILRVQERLCAEVRELRKKEQLVEGSQTEQQKMDEVLCHLYACLYKKEQIAVHLANSSTVRSAARVFGDQLEIHCNRGTNGIEGSLSTAVGHALARPEQLVVCAIGDLSFFYDANALWNVALPSNLRILLLNNGHGAIFDTLPGLSASPASRPLIAAGERHYSAEGLCLAYGVDYDRTSTHDYFGEKIKALLTPHDHAALLEVDL